jgi:hypothetical protein
MNFKCSHTWNDGNKDIWEGCIESFIDYGNYYEMNILSRSSINLIFGKYSYGLFAVVPIYGGTYLSYKLEDVFYNTERLCTVFDNTVDAVTAATALATISKKVKFTM